MSTRQAVEETNYAISASQSHVVRYLLTADRELWSGSVVTPCGVVAVYTQRQAADDTGDYSSYRVVWGGREYVRTERRWRPVRGLATQATKFARRIVMAASEPREPEADRG